MVLSVCDLPVAGGFTKLESQNPEPELTANINEMMKLVLDMLDPSEHFLILNAYSLGFSSMILENLVRTGSQAKTLDIGELYLKDKYEKKLPLGAFVRYRAGSGK